MLNVPRRSSLMSLRLILCAILVNPVVLALFPASSEAQATPVSSQTTLALSASSVAAHTAVTLTASVTAGGASLTDGVITFCDATAAHCADAAVVGTAELTAAGTATLRIVPAIGSHTYKAVFSATKTAAASTSSPQTLTVTGPLYPTTTAIAASGTPNNYSLTATVVGVASNPPLLTGTVSFQDTSNHNLVLGTASLGTPAFAQSLTQAAGSPVLTGINPAVVGTGDFNGDGIPDLAVMNSGDNTVSILLGNGDGTFTQAAGSPVGPVGTTPCVILTGPSNCAITVGDFNRDGYDDLALTSGGDDTVTVLLGNGRGGFTPAAGSPISVGTFPEAIKTADFNNDGILDLAVANADDNTVSILLGKGDGTFALASGSPILVGNFPFFMAVADFNGDGNADLAVVNGIDDTVSILLGNGDGTFNAASGSPIPVGDGACPVVAADFNGDGKVDLAVANFSDNDVDVFLGNGDGTFTPATGSPVAVGSQPFAMIAGDFNQDGQTDLAVVNYGDQTLTILLGEGNGQFKPSGPATTLGDSPNDVASADFNGDGTPDFAIPDLADNDMTVLLNHISQTATATLDDVSIPGSGTHYVDASYSGNTYFAPSTSAAIPLIGSTVPTTLTLTATPTQQLVTMQVTLIAQLAATTGVPNGSVSFFDGGVLLGTATINAAGQAVYPTSSLADGVHSITASYTGNTSFLPSASPSAVSVTISDLKIALTGGNTKTIIPGTTVTYTFQVSPLVASTFLYDVNITVAGLPPGATSSFSPAILPAGGGATTVTLTVNTAELVGSNAPPSPPYHRLPLAFGLLLPFLGITSAHRRIGKLRGIVAGFLLILSLGAIATLSGCSNAGFFAQKKTTYTMTVTASSGTLQRSTSVPLAIQ